MTIEVKVPLLPESISDATVSTWHKKAGDSVTRDENIVDLETDKVMLEVPAPADGVIKEIIKKTGDTVHAQDILAVIEEGAKARPTQSAEESKPATKAAQREEAPAQPAQTSKPAPTSTPSAAAALSPSARRAAQEREVDLSGMTGTGPGGRITKENVIAAASSEPPASRTQAPAAKESPNKAPTSSTDVPDLSSGRPVRRVAMTRIRQRIAERLLEVKQNTAMLTTFNEINMAAVSDIRQRYRDKFEKRYKVRLGFMSFFVRACVEALKRAPVVNASIDGNDIVYHGYYDIGVAVSTERGLIVPVIRDADKLSMADIEIKISELAEKARTGKLSLEEMQGGTFTITNGGVFGSLMATPIINAPQCAILGMHKIQDRPVVENGQIVIRPMMYVALSYDHRLIDGKESVTFLVSIKDMLEDPARILIDV